MPTQKRLLVNSARWRKTDGYRAWLKAYRQSNREKLNASQVERLHRDWKSHLAKVRRYRMSQKYGPEGAYMMEIVYQAKSRIRKEERGEQVSQGS